MARQFLVVTGELATSYPALDQGEPRPIIPHGDDDFAATCPRGGEPLALRRTDVLVRRFDQMRLARAIGKALGATLIVEPVAGEELAWRIGNLPLAFGARPVFMTIPWDSLALASAIDVLTSQYRHPYLLLAPTRRWVNAIVESKLDTTDGIFFAMCDLVQPTNDGHLQISSLVMQSLATMLGVGPIGGVTANVFQRQGDKWVVSFDGTTIYEDHSVGLNHLARLLAKPHKKIPVVLLDSDQTGVHPDVLKGSLGVLMDYEYREECRERRKAIKEELGEAKRNHDHARLEKLQEEDAFLKKEVAKATGLNGRLRKYSDIGKARKRVGTAVWRSIGEFETKHPPLFLHRSNTINTGLLCSYTPERDPCWLI